LSEAVKAGARYAGYVIVRLPYAVKELFEQWLEQHFPTRKNKVLNRIRDIRGGKLNDPRFKSRMRGEGVFAEQIRSLFTISCKKAGITGRSPDFSTDHFRNASDPQLTLF
jgi:DNA repair photolyase